MTTQRLRISPGNPTSAKWVVQCLSTYMQDIPLHSLRRMYILHILYMFLHICSFFFAYIQYILHVEVHVMAIVFLHIFKWYFAYNCIFFGIFLHIECIQRQYTQAWRLVGQYTHMPVLGAQIRGLSTCEYAGELHEHARATWVELCRVRVIPLIIFSPKIQVVSKLKPPQRPRSSSTTRSTFTTHMVLVQYSMKSNTSMCFSAFSQEAKKHIDLFIACKNFLPSSTLICCKK